MNPFGARTGPSGGPTDSPTIAWDSGMDRDQHISGLEVAMDHGLVMGMLYAIADLQEQVQSLSVGQLLLVAVLGDGHPLDMLHHEVGPPAR